MKAVNDIKRMIEEIIYDVIDELNEQLPIAERAVKSPGTPLAGTSLIRDSLATITFLVTLEERLAKQLISSVSLITDDMMAMDPGPLRTVATLVEHIHTLERQATHAQ